MWGAQMACSPDLVGNGAAPQPWALPAVSPPVANDVSPGLLRGVGSDLPPSVAAASSRLSETSGLIDSLINLGGVELRAGRRVGRAKLESAITLSRRYGLEDHAARAISCLVSCCLRTRSVALAEQYLNRGFDYCAEAGLDDWRVLLLAYRARLELLHGRWNAATESATSVLRDDAGHGAPRGWALATLGVIRARRGDPGSHETLDQARDAVRSTGELDRLAAVAAARAEAAWLAGNEVAVATETDDALALAVRLDASWIAGELALLRSHVGGRQILPMGAIAHPYRLSITGAWSEAAWVWTRLGCPYEAALALAGSDDKSARHDGLEQLRQMGARRTAAIINQQDRKVRSPSKTRHNTHWNLAGLTARELEVLRLIATGLRNAEIAKRLVISPKTVDHHVSAVLRKLNARTRLDASLHALDLGVITTMPGAPAGLSLTADSRTRHRRTA